ncbi:MAG: MarR family transcriptional regulator [Treponema sp.]|jgi:DNA-binding MarR family transcriptional regulator|nr:MarR family transcriptional regulator [Treponema sp.]
MKTNGGFYISRIKQIQDRIFYKMLEKAGIDISSGQGRILYVLWEESPLTISEIGKRTSLAKTTLTAMLDRMEENAMIMRLSDKQNRRQIHISLTEKAIDLKEKYRKVSDEMTDIFYKGFSEKEILDFETKLEKILTNLSEKEND